MEAMTNAKKNPKNIDPAFSRLWSFSTKVRAIGYLIDGLGTTHGAPLHQADIHHGLGEILNDIADGIIAVSKELEKDDER